MLLKELGWSDYFEKQIDRNFVSKIGRITQTQRDRIIVHDGNKEFVCELSGKLRHEIVCKDELPAIGDWCVLGKTYYDASLKASAFIDRILLRKSKLRRIAPGELCDEQILAANIDKIFIVTSANLEFSLNKIERFVLLANSGGATPIIIISKIDLVTDYELEKFVDQIKTRFDDIMVICTSAECGTGIDQLKMNLAVGETGIFVGASGVGKSSLINVFMNEKVQEVKEIRDFDHKGRHTTTTSTLFRLPGNGNIIDTPGIRGMQVIGDCEECGQYDHVLELFTKCKFSNCSHQNEPGCAINAALESGELDYDSYFNFLKMKKEAKYHDAKLNQKKHVERKKKWLKDVKAFTDAKKERKKRNWKKLY